MRCVTLKFSYFVVYFHLALRCETINPFPHNDTFQAFWKHCGKRRICSLRAISPFPTVFSSNFVKFEISVCKLFQFERVKNLSSGNGLSSENNFHVPADISGRVYNTQMVISVAFIRFRSRDKGPYSPTILKNILCLCLQDLQIWM